MFKVIRIVHETFDPAAELAQFDFDLANDTGAVISFVGKVREDAEGGCVTALALEHFPGMTERSISTFIDEAAARWPLLGVKILHRVGSLMPGEPIVLVCCASAHRRAAFDATDFLMDYLKTKALFWKKETRGDSSVWIEPTTQDYDHAAGWTA